MGSSVKLHMTTVALLVVFALTDIRLDAATPLIMTWTKLLAEPAVSVEWSPNGESIFFGNSDINQVNLLNWRTSEVIWQTPFPESNLAQVPHDYSARWSQDGNWIAVTNNWSVYVIDAQTGNYHPLSISAPSERDQPAYTIPRWGSDSISLAVLDTNGSIDIVNSTTGEILQTISLSGGTRYSDLYISAFDWSPDGQFLAAPFLRPSMNAETIGFWNNTGNLVEAYTQESVTDLSPPMPCPRGVSSSVADNLTFLEWANDSRTLAVGLTYGLAVCKLHDDGTIDVRELQSYGSSFHWSPDQHWLAGAINTATSVWIADTGNNYETVSVQPPNGSAVNSFAWSPDSQHLALGTRRELWIGTLELPQ
ncbi:MAG: hypothetical protein IPO91_03965 [Chloroflexi bacterium]|nr:hypothetical protein [Chloroflexota bacterium]